MKSTTEFPSYLLNRGIEAKTALVAEGKSPEEIQASLGGAFKLEGDRLKHFCNCLDIAAKNTGLSRMVVISLAEGEKAPAKAVQVEEHYYVPEFLVLAQPQQPSRDGRGGHGKGRQGGGGGGGGRNSGGSKGSPYGPVTLGTYVKKGIDKIPPPKK